MAAMWPNDFSWDGISSGFDENICFRTTGDDRSLTNFVSVGEDFCKEAFLRSGSGGVEGSILPFTV